MDGLCRRREGNGAAAVRSSVELLAAEAALAAQRSLLWLLFVMDSLSNNIGVWNEGSDVRHMILEGIKPETMPENKDAGESDVDDADGDEHGNDQDDDGGKDSDEEGNDEGDEDEDDPEANGEGGSEDDGDEHDQEDDDEDNEDDGDEDEYDEEDDEEEEPPSKKKK